MLRGDNRVPERSFRAVHHEYLVRGVLPKPSFDPSREVSKHAAINLRVPLQLNILFETIEVRGTVNLQKHQSKAHSFWISIHNGCSS